MNQRQELCPKCGRGYPLDGDFLPQHNVIKPNGTSQSVVCKGSGEYIAPPVPVAPETKKSPYGERVRRNPQDN